MVIAVFIIGLPRNWVSHASVLSVVAVTRLVQKHITGQTSVDVTSVNSLIGLGYAFLVTGNMI